jgi:hypothetical protein
MKGDGASLRKRTPYPLNVAILSHGTLLHILRDKLPTC